MSTWFTSDLHIGHRLVAGKRGYWDEDIVDDEGNCAPDPEEHDFTLAQMWDSTVDPTDTVWVLGDISINGGQHALDWIHDRPGTKHLVTGNHDPVNPQKRTAQKLQRRWMEYFETIQPHARLRYGKQNYLLSHYPYWSYGDGPERESARDEQWRLPDLGLPLLHGHTHGKERAHDNMFHVGLDAWDLQLVPQSTIFEWLDTLKDENPSSSPVGLTT